MNQQVIEKKNLQIIFTFIRQKLNKKNVNADVCFALNVHTKILKFVYLIFLEVNNLKLYAALLNEIWPYLIGIINIVKLCQ